MITRIGHKKHIRFNGGELISGNTDDRHIHRDSCDKKRRLQTAAFCLSTDATKMLANKLHGRGSAKREDATSTVDKGAGLSNS